MGQVFGRNNHGRAAQNQLINATDDQLVNETNLTGENITIGSNNQDNYLLNTANIEQSSSSTAVNSQDTYRSDNIHRDQTTIDSGNLSYNLSSSSSSSTSSFSSVNETLNLGNINVRTINEQQEQNQQETTNCNNKCTTKESVSFISMVKSRWKQLLFILLITLIAVFGLTPYITSRISSPSPFLFKSSRIVDFANGDLTKLSIKILDHEVSFVMYYAPWDLDCIRFAKQYEQLANLYKGQLFFAAINCWWPNGECAKVMRLKRFPIFLAHIRDVGDIEYRGPLVLSYVMPFLDNLLDPVVPLHHPGDLLELRSKHDVSTSVSTSFTVAVVVTVTVVTATISDTV